MSRNISNYSKPHIIGEKKQGRAGVRGRGRKSLGKIVLITFIVAVILFGLVFGVYLYGPFNFRLKTADYYTLTLTRTDSLKDAEDASKVVSAAGGAGYILNDGNFLVAAFVYKSEKDARTVLERFEADYPDAEVKAYNFKRTKIKRGDDRDAEKQLKQLLNYPLSLIDEVIEYVYQLDSFESGESAVMLKIEELKTGLKQKSEQANALAARHTESCYKAVAEFYKEIYDSLVKVSLLENSDKKLTHRLKNVSCGLVEKYWDLRQSL